MSKYGTLETEIKEQKYLVAALAEMGYRTEIHLQGSALVGFEGGNGRNEQTSSSAGSTWIPRRTTSASRRARMADTPRSSVSMTSGSDSTRNG